MEYKNEVYWYTLKEPKLQTLSAETISDVIVIGGGLTGLIAALTFAKRGKSVVLLEKEYCGAGASGKSSGFITPDSELELSNLIPAYGPIKAKKIWEFVSDGVELIRENIKVNNILCDYQVQDSLFISNGPGTNKKIKAEYDSRKELNYDAELYSEKDILQVIGSKKYFSAVRYPNTYGINSYLFCQGLREVLIGLGVRVFENSNVRQIEGAGVWVENKFCQAKTIIFCGDRFIPDLGQHKKDIFHGQTFLAISKPLQEEQAKKVFPKDRMMVWDTDLIYQYYRITGENRLLIGGSNIPLTYAKNEKRPAAEIFKKLSEYLNSMFPGLGIELEYMWPGLIGVTKDFLPIISADPKLTNVYYVGAGAGLPWSAAIGKYIAEKILDGRSDFDEYFRADRFKRQNWIQSLLGTKLAFSIFQGLRKL